MSKPFELWFPFCPKWKKNRERPQEEQLTVKLRDLPESGRVAEQESMMEELMKIAPDAAFKENPTLAFNKMSKGRLEIVHEKIKKHLISFSLFSVIDADGKEKEIKDFDDMWAECSDLVVELYGRLLNGPDAEELKN